MKPKWEIKCWGKVWHRFNDEYLNESLLKVNAGWQCSIHWHKNRWNCFINIDATIGIENFGPANEKPKLVDNIIIEAGKSYVVPPETWHRFYVIKSGKIAELYWTTNGMACDVNDINRDDVGGKR